MNMKKYILFLFFSVIIISSCKKDYLTTSAPPDNSAPIDLTKPISFKDAIVPIFISNCLGSGCHITGGQSPVLTADKAYDQLTQLGYVDAATPDTIAANSTLYKRLIGTTKPMPPTGKLSISKISAIELWIKQGSNNN